MRRCLHLVGLRGCGRWRGPTHSADFGPGANTYANADTNPYPYPHTYADANPYAYAAPDRFQYGGVQTVERRTLSRCGDGVDIRRDGTGRHRRRHRQWCRSK